MVVANCDQGCAQTTDSAPLPGRKAAEYVTTPFWIVAAIAAATGLA